MLVHHCKTVKHRGISVNESYDNTFARKRLKINPNTVIKNIEVLLASSSTLLTGNFIYLMSLSTRKFGWNWITSSKAFLVVPADSLGHFSSLCFPFVFLLRIQVEENPNQTTTLKPPQSSNFPSSPSSPKPHAATKKGFQQSVSLLS